MKKLLYLAAVFVQTAFAQDANQVCFYEHYNYQGSEACYSVSESEPESKIGWVGSARNDQFSSVKVGSNVIATGYQHGYFQGANWVFTSNSNAFGSMNDHISSLIVKKKSSDNQVCFYEHGNYQGRETCYSATESQNMIDLVGSSLNDQFSSVKVGSNVVATGYEHRYFQGANWIFSENSSTFGSANDQISSVIVRPKSAVGTYGNSTWLTYHFLGAHNAHVNYGEGAWSFVNQDKNYEELLNAGVRVLNLDVFDSRSYGGYRDAYLCHGTCSGTLGINHIWAMPTFTNALQRIGNWTRSHPNEIVTVTIEDHIGDTSLFNRAINYSNISDIQFNTHRDRVGGNWPLLNSMVNSNKRLIVLTSNWQNAHAGNGVGYDREFITENYWTMGAFGNDRSCSSRWSEPSLSNTSKSMHMSHFRDVSGFVGAAIDNSYQNLSSRINNECYQASGGRKPNIILLNHATIGAGKQIVDELNRNR